MSKRYALAKDGIIINVVVVDEEYTPDEGIELVESGESGPEIGWMRQGGVWVAPPEQQADDDYTGRDPEYIIDHTTKAVQKRLDDFAKTRNYDGILSAATYATSAVPKFASEGQYAAVARDATWAALYAMMEAVQTGQRPMPANYAEVESELPTLEWPA